MVRPRRPLPRPAEHAGPALSSFTNLQAFQHSNFLTLFKTIPFIIRTYIKSACNSFRIRTSKTQALKPFRMNTYEKTPRGVPPSGQNFPVFAVSFVVNHRISSFYFRTSSFDPHGTNPPLARLHRCGGDVHA